MNLLARNTDYAVRAILYMARQKDVLVSTADLDRDLNLPRPFMRKTLQILQKEGYLTSVKGNKGGFKLKRKPSSIFLIDLMRIFQGEISLSDCLFKKKLCECVVSCPLRRVVKAMESDLLKKLKAVTIADLMKDGTHLS
jgi:Rrf2 family protein